MVRGIASEPNSLSSGEDATRGDLVRDLLRRRSRDRRDVVVKNEKIGELVIVDGESYCRRWSFNDAPFLNSSRDFSTIPDTRTKPGVYLVYDSSDILVRIGSCHTLRENSRSKNGDINKNSWGVLGRLVDDLASTQSCLLKFIMVLLEDTP